MFWPGVSIGTAGLIVATIFEVVVIFVVFEAIPKNYAVALRGPFGVDRRTRH